MKITLLIPFLFGYIYASQLTGFIRPSYNSTENLNDLKVLLNGKIETRVDKSGLFIFPDLPKGKYELRVISIDYTYPRFEIENDENGIQAFWVDKKEGGYIPVSLPLQISETNKNIFFDLKEPFNIVSYLKSPYGIMILVTLALILCMKNMPSTEELQSAATVQK